MNPLESKKALIIGGGSGIGQAIAVSLASAGCHCAVAGRTVEKLSETAALFGGEPKILTHAVDVADRERVSQLFDWFNTSLGAPDILVNAAGVNIRDRSMSAMSPEEWDNVIQINATGAYNCLSAVLPLMRKKNDGIIIQISSVSGRRATPLGGVAYNASKFAMTALGTAVGNEESANGIRVTNIYPGEVNTPILDQRAAPPSPEQRALMVQPQDIAELVLTICALPRHAHVPELVIKPLGQAYV